MSHKEQDQTVASVGSDGNHRIYRHVLAGLVRAMDWFDNGLQNLLAARGFKTLHRTQSMIMLHIAGGIESPADIAREMGLTRQNVHHMAKSLIADGLIEQAPDPRDPRRTMYRLSDSSRDIRGEALEILRDLELALAGRIGHESVAALKRVIGSEWGAEIRDDEELNQALGASTRSAREG